MKTPPDIVRLGIVGMGVMGAGHAKTVLEGRGGRLALAAVADANAERLAALDLPSEVVRFASPEALVASREVDAVLVATPHFSHPDLAIATLQAGRHVLVEKPIAVHKAEARRLIDAHTDPKLVFAAMFNQRTDPKYLKLRSLIEGGHLGRIQRINWTITTWFRPDAYYASGSWRATWAGEGGGVLLNQCPHQLDLWQWLFGMPDEVQARCRYGKWHDIEVEDDVTALFDYADGASGVFITTTGEAPGSNRLEIAADRGRVVVENGRIDFIRNEIPAAEFSRTSKEAFSVPPVWNVHIPTTGAGPQHAGILANFADAILDGAPLVAPGAEGIRSVELANAMLLSSAEDRRLALPLDAARYEAWLKERMAESRYRRPPTP